MATLMTDTERNALADYQAGRISYLSLHTASPGTTGASETTGGSPAYARKAITFTSAGAQGTLGAVKQPATVGVAWSSEVVFDAPAGTYTHWGTWTASTSGTYRIGNALDLPETSSGQTQVTVSIGVGQVAGA
jgi:hypothetical protein